MDLNLVSIVYLFYRLAPFIIVCFFTLNSIINQDLRGLMYLSGLLMLLSVVFLSSKNKYLFVALVLNIILMWALGMIKLLDIFKPFKLIYKALQIIFKNLIFSITTIVVLVLLIGSYVLHFYEINKLGKLENTLADKNNLFNVYSNMINVFKYIEIDDENSNNNDPDGYCMEFSINGNEIKKPLAATIYGFTYGYLMFFINKYNLINNNIPILTLFPVLIFGDLAFQKMHYCRPSLFTNIIALFLGITWGVNWGEIVASMKKASLQYFVGANQPGCSVPSKQKFKCDLYQNGQLISTKRLASK